MPYTEPASPSPPTALDEDGLSADASSVGDSLSRGRSFAKHKWRPKELVIEGLLFLAAASSILITLGIVGILVYEASAFFRHVGLWAFLTDTEWTPLFENPRYGILP